MKLREITGTHLRLSRGRPDTGREREAAKLRDETAERNPPCARAASPEYAEAARLDQKGNPRDRLYSSSRCRDIRASSLLLNPTRCVLYRPVKVQIILFMENTKTFIYSMLNDLNLILYL